MPGRAVFVRKGNARVIGCVEEADFWGWGAASCDAAKR